METKKCPFCAELIKVEAIKCKHCGEFIPTDNAEATQAKHESSSIHNESENTQIDEKLKDKLVILNNLIIEEKKNKLGKSKKEEILELISDLCSTKDNAVLVINNYKKLFNASLVDGLKGNNNSYNGIKEMLLPLISVGVLSNEYPHSPIDKEIIQEPVKSIINQKDIKLSSEETSALLDFNLTKPVVIAFLIAFITLIPLRFGKWFPDYDNSSVSDIFNLISSGLEIWLWCLFADFISKLNAKKNLLTSVIVVNVLILVFYILALFSKGNENMEIFVGIIFMVIFIAYLIVMFRAGRQILNIKTSFKGFTLLGYVMMIAPIIAIAFSISSEIMEESKTDSKFLENIGSIIMVLPALFVGNIFQKAKKLIKTKE